MHSVPGFWTLALLVAVVQGGSRALSRSLFADLSPKVYSGEFFGLFSVMSKFSAILGPLVFAQAIAVFGSSRPAILVLVAFFAGGGLVLYGVDVEAGRKKARAIDAEFLKPGDPDSR